MWDMSGGAYKIAVSCEMSGRGLKDSSIVWAMSARGLQDSSIELDMSGRGLDNSSFVWDNRVGGANKKAV